MNQRTKLAIVGTQGLPNQYGGFETLVEFLAKYLSSRFEITVFCSSRVYSEKLDEIHGCKLVYLPFDANGSQSVLYDIVSILKSVKEFDKILVLGVSGGIILPFLRKYKEKFILNFGGLDWKRSKWGRCASAFLKLSEAMAVKNSKILISDNLGIQEYIKRQYTRDSILIEYGGDQVTEEGLDPSDIERYSFLKQEYAFSVARIQSDNNIEMIIEAFIEDVTMPIVLVGNWDKSNYGRELKVRYSECEKLVLLNAIYDQRELNKLRSNCALYVHGHSAGGTNPSLVEAMNLGLPICCFSSGYNEHTTEHNGLYFHNKEELRILINKTSPKRRSELGDCMKSIAKRRYQWKTIAEKYAACLNNTSAQ